MQLLQDPGNANPTVLMTGNDNMITVTLYTRADCELCKQAEEDLNALQAEIPHKLAFSISDSDPALHDILPWISR